MSRRRLKKNIMNTNKILLGGIAGGVTFLLLKWVVYGVLLFNYITTNQNPCAMIPMKDFIWWAMILCSLAYGFLLSMVFDWSKTTGILAGAKVAGIIGLLFSASYDLGSFATSSKFSNLTSVFVAIIAYTVMSAICGVVIAWVMGKVKNKS